MTPGVGGRRSHEHWVTFGGAETVVKVSDDVIDVFRPTESWSSPGVTPATACCSAVSWLCAVDVELCAVDVEWRISDRTSSRFATWERNSKRGLQASKPGLDAGAHDVDPA